jgi:hypothetical protein
MPIARNRFPNGRATPYPAMRQDLRNGDILLCSGSGIFSTMIQAATKSVWSHVGFILRLDNVDRVMLLESVESIGVRTVRLSKYLNDYDSKGNAYRGGLAIIRHKRFEELVNPTKFKRLTQYAVDQFGYPYDSAQIARIAARIMASRVPFTPKERSRIKENNAFICSEYVARCFNRAGFDVKWNPLGFITPADFATADTFELVGVLKRP